MGRSLARALQRCANLLAAEPGDRGTTTRVLLGSRARIDPGLFRPVNTVQQASLVVPAKQEAYDVHHGDANTFSRTAPPVAFDHFGAISMVTDDQEEGQQVKWQNQDGKRHEDGRYASFAAEISAFIPSESPQVTDPFCSGESRKAVVQWPASALVAAGAHCSGLHFVSGRGGLRLTTCLQQSLVCDWYSLFFLSLHGYM